MKTFEDKAVKLDEKEGNCLDSTFKEREELLCDLNSGGGRCFGVFPNSEEEGWTGRWCISTFESCLTFETSWKEDRLIADSNPDLERFLNAVIVDSNLDEIRCMKLECWKEDFERWLVYSRISSMKFSD